MIFYGLTNEYAKQIEAPNNCWVGLRPIIHQPIKSHGSTKVTSDERIRGLRSWTNSYNMKLEPGHTWGFDGPQAIENPFFLFAFHGTTLFLGITLLPSKGLGSAQRHNSLLRRWLTTTLGHGSHCNLQRKSRQTLKAKRLNETKIECCVSNCFNFSHSSYTPLEISNHAFWFGLSFGRFHRSWKYPP